MISPHDCVFFTCMLASKGIEPINTVLLLFSDMLRMCTVFIDCVDIVVTTVLQSMFGSLSMSDRQAFNPRSWAAAFKDGQVCGHCMTRTRLTSMRARNV